ncbi:hypothetical protein P5V15_011819 [Pogonomyrmex californicus]
MRPWQRPRFRLSLRHLIVCAYRLHRQASVTIIIGGTKRHWPNWRRSAERFAFGIAVQLRAATRDFPVHDRLHASQTPKGCSFTGLPPPAGVGSSYRMDDGWAAGDRDAATTTTTERVRSSTMVRGTVGGAVGHIAAVPKQTYDLDKPNRFLVGSLPGNRLRDSYAEGASYCWRSGRPMPSERYLVNFASCGYTIAKLLGKRTRRF